MLEVTKVKKSESKLKIKNMSNLEILKFAFKGKYSPYCSFDEKYDKLKLFPCYDYNSSDYLNTLPEQFHYCHKCGETLEVNDFLKTFTCYLVFESVDDAYLVCSRKCIPKNAMDYYDQVFGFREPVTLHQKFQDDERYRAVYSRIFQSYKKYKLRAYPNGINLDLFYELGLHTDYEGGTYYFKDGTRGDIIYTSKELTVGIHVSGYQVKALFTLTIPNIIKIVNDIIDAYNSTQESLF